MLTDRTMSTPLPCRTVRETLARADSAAEIVAALVAEYNRRQSAKRSEFVMALAAELAAYEMVRRFMKGSDR